MQDAASQPPQLESASDAVDLLDGLAAQPTLLRLNLAARQLPRLRELLGRVPLRLACLSSFTIDPLKHPIELQGIRAGFAIDSYIAPYGRFEQELIDSASGLEAFDPQAVLCAVRLRDTCPSLYDGFNSHTPAAIHGMLDGWMSRLADALKTFRQRRRTPVLLQNYEMPAAPALGIADAGAAEGQSALIREANLRLHQLAAEIPNVYVMDYDQLVSRVGRDNWSDERTRLFARIPIASQHYWRLAGFFVRHLRPLFGLSKKVLVLDADNTLWGGVVGDVGIHDIQLGSDFPGNAFVEFQKKILDLHSRGVILAIASKNEPGSVQQVLTEHPQMVLREQHFSALRVNWDPKPGNLRQIADLLNLGIDSFVFIDDSPVECELMRRELPEVLTIQLPPDPSGYPSIIDRLDCFDQWTISEEDRQRGELYRAEGERKQLQAAVVDMPTFYRRLEMKLSLYVNHAPHASRAAQMSSRTNQFNMHTVRLTDDDIRALMSDGRHLVITAALVDRFGDNGVIGMTVVRTGSPAWRIPLFLMSCRVLGRTVEQTFLRWIAQQARSAGAQRLEAEFVPTVKNRPFAGFYSQCGLTQSPPAGDIEVWCLNLEGSLESLPDWIDLTVHGMDG